MRARLVTILLLIALPALALNGDLIHLRAGTLAGPPARSEEPADGLWMVKLHRAPGAVERRALEDAGAEILSYLPVSAYLLRTGDIARIEALDAVAWTAPYAPAWRADPVLLERGAESPVTDLVLDLIPGSDARRALSRAAALGAEPLSAVELGRVSRIHVRAGGASLPRLLELPGLAWMEEALPAEDRLNESTWVIQSTEEQNWSIWDMGIHGEDQILGHMDSGFAVDNCFFDDRSGAPIGPEHRKVVYLGPSLPHNGSHGMHTAGILAGDIEPWYPEWTITRGIAYKARLASTRYNTGGFDLYAGLVSHHEQGARVHSNSWGTDGTTSYTQRCRDIDMFSHDYETSMVAFAITNSWEYVQTPENAKNVLAVAASRNAPENFDEHCVGGQAPTADGRRKPDLLAPGCDVLSAMYSISGANPESPGEYCRTNNNSGTSMACPHAAGSGALWRQYFMEGWYPGGQPERDEGFEPSGALLRAALVNSTVDMTGPGLEGYPSPKEGWGRLKLDEGFYFLGQVRSNWLADVRHAQGLETGAHHAYQFEILEGEDPLRVTLAFSDAPGWAGAAEPVVNDLGLEVIAPSGAVFSGNVFGQDQSQEGGQPDAINCVERVLRHDPEPGLWTLRVWGVSVPEGPQGYAVIVSGNLPVEDLVPPQLVLAAVEEEGVLLVTGQADEALLSAECTVEWLHSGETAGPLAMALEGDACSLVVPANPEDTGAARVTVRVRDLGQNETVEILEGDWMAPRLLLSFYAVAADTLGLGILASEELDEAWFDLDGQILSALWVSPELYWYETLLPVAVTGDSLSLDGCGEDLAGHVACERERLSVYTAGAGEALEIGSLDGRLQVEIPEGALPAAALLLVMEEEARIPLAGYNLQPTGALEREALMSWSYAGCESPLDISLTLNGEGLESFVDAEEGRILAPLDGLGHLVVGLAAGGSLPLDAEFLSLEPAWPNPFVPQLHGEMTLRLALRDRQVLRAEIFDVAGRRVRVLQDTELYPGTAELSWDGDDADGSALGSGVYFVKVSTNEGSVTGKVILIQ